MMKWLWLLLLLYSGVSRGAIELVFWHSLAGHLGEEVNELVKSFNQRQTDYVVIPVYKGEYTDTLTSFASAFVAKKPPAIVQVFEVGTAIMLSPPGIIKPLTELMQEQKISLAVDDFLPALRAFYSKSGALQAFPFNTSIPVMYYNADALAAVGVTAAEFPKTWQAMETLAAKLKKAGHACAYTTAYPAWIHVESFSALHDLPMVDSTRSKALYNNQALRAHLQRLKKWQGQHYFEYGGRANDATILFTSGRCVLFSQSSGSYSSLAALVDFPLGVAALPLDAKVSTVRHNNVVGGAALWAVAGQSDAVYRGIALFYAYLAEPQVQQRWHANTGYIPVGLRGNYAFIIKHSAQPALVIAQSDLGGRLPNALHPYGIPQNQIRAINDEALEAIFAGIKSPSVAINDAVLRANFTLRRFLRNARSLA